MVAVLQNTSVAGFYALHAEPGAGKSTAATLAALELKGRQPKDVIVLLQNDFERQLKSFFRLSNIEYTAEIARPFFTSLRDKGIRVRLILDNVLDSSTIIIQSGDRLRALARAANDNLHQVIVIVQSEAAAQEIGGLNGDTTRKGNQMPAEFYRWSREETEELLKSTNIQELLKKPLRDDEEAEDLNVLLAEALELSEIPDKYGRWRPRSTKRYIMTGDRPTAPLPIPGPSAGSAGTTSASVWVRELARNKDKQLTDGKEFEPTGNAFQVQGAFANVDDLKKAIDPSLSAFQASKINIYSQQDRDWVKEDEDIEVSRGTSKSDCYGFTLPQKTDDV
ncbi:unnamed protein product [Symbiodinium pilosum]|uniref:Uncharacterized protein n=1 Tax=Symbiodinium pilosum TaxID=2952 RepID=A0A812SNE6_SYMPI|nr:unnamed protein product [Symbiodinium pilosum]